MFFRGDENPEKFMKISGDIPDEGICVCGSTKIMKQKTPTDAGEVVQTVKLPWLSLPGA